MKYNEVAGKELAVIGKINKQLKEIKILKSLDRLITENKSASEICTILGISKHALKYDLLKIMYHQKKFIHVDGLFLENSDPVILGKNGDILVNTKMINLGNIKLNSNSNISISVENSRIIIQIK